MMSQNEPSGYIKLLDDFRSGTKMQYTGRTSTFLSNPVSIPATPTILGSKAKKRMFDDTVFDDNHFLIARNNEELEKKTLNDSTGSPWEKTHANSQLAQARAEIKSLENRVSQLHGLRREMEQLHEEEKISLKTTLDQERQTIKNLERRLAILKRREEHLKDDRQSLIEKMNYDRSEKENKNIVLYDEITELKHKMSQLEESIMTKDQNLKLIQVEKSRLESEVKMVNDKCSALTDELAKLRQNVSELETVKGSLENAQLTIKELESARKGYEEMELMVKSQQSKLMRYSELERNLEHYMHQNTKLKESCSNAVHLESLVEEMRERLNTLEEREKDLMNVRVELGVAESKLSEYRSLAAEALGENAGAVQFGTYVRQLQTNSLLLASQKSQLASKVKSMEDTEQLLLAEKTKLKQDFDKVTEELLTANNTLRRLKKQNALITWERNDLRSLIDSCQKEVTISGSHQAMGMGEGRVELLEKMVENYRERIKQMEADPSLITPGVNNTGSPSVEKDTAELEKIRKENKELKEKIEKLEYEFEHRALRGDFNVQNTKVLHFKMNPASEAINSREDELAALKKELIEKDERLKMYLEGNMIDVTQEIAQRQDVTKEVIELREKVKSQETVNQRLKEAFKTKGHEFREAIFQLLGYKVDGLPNNLYRLSSLYAEAQEQYLMFKMTSNGMELLETEYSKMISDLVEEVLLQCHSIPVFLSTLTNFLFKKQSDSMSTTSL